MENNTGITDVRVLATEFMMYKIGKFEFTSQGAPTFWMH